MNRTFELKSMHYSSHFFSSFLLNQHRLSDLKQTQASFTCVPSAFAVLFPPIAFKSDLLLLLHSLFHFRLRLPKRLNDSYLRNLPVSPKQVSKTKLASWNLSGTATLTALPFSNYPVLEGFVNNFVIFLHSFPTSISKRYDLIFSIFKIYTYAP